jgi:polysaccharide biosynthesis/export protein
MPEFVPMLMKIALMLSSTVQTTYAPQPANQNGLDQTRAERQATDTQPSNVPAVLRIGTGDLLEISISTVIGAPEENWKTRVSPSGEITLPMAGSVHVAGVTADEAQAIIEKKYKDAEILRSPQVLVLILEYASQGVSVMGEVLKPGVYPLLTSRRLLDLLAQAGGLTPTAGRTITITHRDHALEPETVSLSRDPKQNTESNIEIKPGDTIVVAKAGVVYVVGAVAKPGGFTMDANDGLTLLQAIALAEGTKPDAAMDKSRLIRKTPNGPTEIPISLRKILSSKTPDIKLQSDDIVFVPSSAVKSAARRSLEAIVQTATGVAIFRR